MILSAVTGKAVLKVFTQSSLAVVTTRKTLIEVEEYLPEMADRYEIPRELLEGQLGLLTIRPFGKENYRRTLAEALRRIGGRDPDDADLLALALALRIPIWSNDNDFSLARVEWFTTARLLKTLGIH